MSTSAFFDCPSARAQSVIGAGKWAQLYQARYRGSVADFLRTHPEAFFQRKADGAFYRPDPPARHPQQPLPHAQPQPQAAVAVTPAAPVITPPASRARTLPAPSLPMSV